MESRQLNKKQLRAREEKRRQVMYAKLLRRGYVSEFYYLNTPSFWEWLKKRTDISKYTVYFVRFQVGVCLRDLPPGKLERIKAASLRRDSFHEYLLKTGHTHAWETPTTALFKD